MIQNKKLGVAFLPGTFPTGDVLFTIQKSLPMTADEWNRTKVNDMYFRYKEAIREKGYKAYSPPDEIAVKQYIIDNTNYSEADIRVFLFTLFKLAGTGDLNQKWWNPTLQKDISDIKLPGIPDPTDYLKQLKWVGLIALGGVFLYFSWPFLMGMRRKLKRRK